MARFASSATTGGGLHLLLFGQKIKLILLEAFLSDITDSSMRHPAEPVGVAPSMVCTAIPCNFLERADYTLCDRGIVPFIVLCIFPKSKAVTVILDTRGIPPSVPQGSNDGPVAGAFEGNFLSLS